MRLLIRPRLPAIALLLLAPTIPELLTGSTPIAPLVTDPAAFAFSFIGIVALYGTGALLIREFAVVFRKGWASILLLGAAYGIAEEGFAVHTFFAPPGGVVGALGGYGHLFGVNWLWALGLTAFHATYSIALPILLTQLWFPGAKEARWLDRGLTVGIGGVFLVVVAFWAFLVGHGPSLPILAFFLAVEGSLLALATWAPRDLLSVRPGPRRVGRLGLVVAGSLGFDVWVAMLVFSADPRVPAIAAAAVLVGVNLVALAVVLGRVGQEQLDLSKFYFAVGMFAPLFAWDIAVELLFPGILAVSALYAYLLFRLHRALARRASVPTQAAPVTPPA